jgi:hypothetical protein
MVVFSIFRLPFTRKCTYIDGKVVAVVVVVVMIVIGDELDM